MGMWGAGVPPGLPQMDMGGGYGPVGKGPQMYQGFNPLNIIKGGGKGGFFPGKGFGKGGYNGFKGANGFKGGGKGNPMGG